MNNPSVPPATERSSGGSKLANTPEIQLHDAFRATMLGMWTKKTYVERLKYVRKLVALAREIERRTVLGAHDEGASWNRIGMTMGMTGSSAHGRFARGVRQDDASALDDDAATIR